LRGRCSAAPAGLFDDRDPARRQSLDDADHLFVKAHGDAPLDAIAGAIARAVNR